MRLTIIFVTAFGLLFSCSSNDTTKFTNKTVNEKQRNDTVANNAERELLVKELKRLQAIIASKDKEKIADIFHFPLSDTTVGIYTDDSTFNAQYEKNGNKTTRAMFLHYFPEISESLQINQLNQLFKKIDIDSLLQKDTLEYKAIIKTEPCYRYYGVGIEKDLVTLILGINSNKDFKSKLVSENEVPENASEICEHVLWWTFWFDGKTLRFKNISGAG